MGISKIDETAGMKLLITGYKKLRIEAENQGVEVHRSIWVIRSLVANGLIDRKKGNKLLESLKEELN